ncbi:MAG: SDR family oxidoreductase [Bacteroidota bacterium]
MYEQAYHPGTIDKTNFLVTGGAGFIGSHIVEYLMKHGAAKVRVLDNLATGFKKNIESYFGNPHFEFIEGDICNTETCATACSGIDYVIHQAALGSIPRSVKDPAATNATNVNGQLNILVAARDAGVKRVVYASSSSVYGDSKTLPKTEDKIGKPLSPYAVTKYVNEMYATVFGPIYNMQIIGLRYFNIFGPRQNPGGPYAAAIPLFIDSLLTNKQLFINGDGEQTRDFTFVENAVQANIRALFTTHTEAPGQVFNIARGGRTSVNELFNILKELTGSSLEPTYREERAGDIRDSLADVSKASALLGYAPAVTIRQGLEITLDWFKIYYQS